VSADVVGLGGTWGPDGTIVFDPGNSGLLRVSSEGGTPQPVTSDDHDIDKSDLSWPQFLPNGRALVATLRQPGRSESTLAVLSLTTHKWRRLGSGSQAQYLPSGHLLYHAPAVREGELHAVAFDEQSLATRGDAIADVDTVFRAQNGGDAYYATAQNGTLVFTPGGYARTLVRRSQRPAHAADRRPPRLSTPRDLSGRQQGRGHGRSPAVTGLGLRPRATLRDTPCGAGS
jgi:hypothetical protein